MSRRKETYDAIGAEDSVIVAAGAEGSVTQKLRRLTEDLDGSGTSLSTLLSLFQDNVDSSSTALVTIQHDHHEIHAGDHYYMEGYTTLASAAALYVKLVTPDTTKWSHFVWGISSSNILTTTLVEAPTGGMTGGSGVTPLNSDRNSSNTSGVVLTSGVTAPTGGLVISQQSFGSKFSSSSASRDNEIIMKQNTTYCRTFVSGAAANIISFHANWYEHTNV